MAHLKRPRILNALMGERPFNPERTLFMDDFNMFSIGEGICVADLITLRCLTRQSRYEQSRVFLRSIISTRYQKDCPAH